MKKFMILYMAPVSAEQQMNVSPEEMKKGMEPWMAWFKKAGTAIVDMGTPLGNGMNYTKSGATKSKSEVTGYTIMQADSMDAVKAMIADNPHFMMPKASIEVFEMMPMIM
jgi:hypothetical protein